MASKVLCKRPQLLSHARDLIEAFAGCFFDVHFRKLRYPIHDSDIIFELGSLIRPTWLSSFMRLILLPCQILEIICLSKFCHGVPLQKYCC
jgi:hypothetical protein